MKKIWYIFLLCSSMQAMEEGRTALPEYMKNTPLEIWLSILSYVVPAHDRIYIKPCNDIKKVKLISRFFYELCDTKEVHELISPSLAISTLVLNTKKKRKQFDEYLFTADQKALGLIFGAAVMLDAAPIIARAIEQGVNPNEKHEFTFFGYTFKTPALYYAAHHGKLKSIRALLKAPTIDPNIVDEPSSTCTALHIAALQNNVEIVKLLLKHPSIDPQRVDINGQTALARALNNHKEKAANILLLDRARREQKAKRASSRLCGGDCAIS